MPLLGNPGICHSPQACPQGMFRKTHQTIESHLPYFTKQEICSRKEAFHTAAPGMEAGTRLIVPKEVCVRSKSLVVLMVPVFMTDLLLVLVRARTHTHSQPFSVILQILTLTRCRLCLRSLPFLPVVTKLRLRNRWRSQAKALLSPGKTASSVMTSN